MKNLKHLCFIGIAALFALAIVMAGCDAFPSAPKAAAGDIWDTSDEPPLKPGEFFVGFNSGSNRALTGPLARAGADFFEVVFVDQSVPATPVVHRAVFREGRYGRMEAPAYDTYDNSGDYKAYIFAGRNDDKTLLGIGVITDTDTGNGSWTPGAAINGTTRRVQFTVQALTTDVNTDGCLNEPYVPVDTSTFKPWNGTTILEKYVSARIMIDNLPASIFLLPPNDTIAATYDVLTDYAEAVLRPAAPAAVVTARGYIWSDGDYAPIEVPTTVGGAMTVLDSGAADPYDGIRFDLTIDTNSAGATSGMGRLSLDVPVVNYTEEDSDNQDIPDLKAPVVWYIRGGMNNALIDQGKDFNNNRGSMGGAILIGVGNVLSGAGGFLVAQK
ncbi:MAG: hypothetical protein LBH43_11605 [Treponema sp.]|jgi:hypothetical protein|nr:hypothetical protein [Treponema sp.]